jgi:hypothetical protein
MPLAYPVVTLLLVALSALAPLALASPPDPIWIGGLFDGDDADDVIVAATSSEGATDGVARPAVKAVLLVVGSVPPAIAISSDNSAAPVFQGRAPPFVSHLERERRGSTAASPSTGTS